MNRGAILKRTRRYRFAIGVGWAIAIVAILAGAVRIIGTAITKVWFGQGAETYTTVWFIQVSYVQVVMDSAVMLLVLLVLIYVIWRDERQWRDFERKYGARK
jgi:hypothetical protein